MTRLTEALERARAGAANAPTIVSRSGDGPQRVVADMPSPWHLDQDVDDVDPDARVEVPNTWHIGEEELESSALTADSFGAPEPVGAVEAARPRIVLDEPTDGFEPREIKSAEPEKLVVGPAANPTVVEQYRRLAAALHHEQLETGACKLMVTSAVEAEGKTLTATNLALTLSESYQRRVLLVDADLRRPTVHQVLKLDNRIGLGDTLKRLTVGGQLPVQRISPTLWIMTAGRPDPDPMSGLVSDVMKEFLVEAAEQFDWIVIDTPPVALLPDASLLAAMVDTALLVVRANTTPYPLVARAVDAIGQSRILGIVLNRVERPSSAADYGYHQYSYGVTAHQEPPRRRRRWRLIGRRAD